MTQCPGCGADWVPADTAFRLADQDARITELEAALREVIHISRVQPVAQLISAIQRAGSVLEKKQ